MSAQLPNRLMKSLLLFQRGLDVCNSRLMRFKRLAMQRMIILNEVAIVSRSKNRTLKLPLLCEQVLKALFIFGFHRQVYCREH